MGANNFGEEGAIEIAKNLIGSNIQTLALYENQIGDEGASKIAKHLGSNITVLKLQYNEIGMMEVLLRLVNT